MSGIGSFVRIVGAFARKDFRVLRSYRVGFITGILATVYGLVSFRFVSHLVGDTKYFGSSSEYFRFVVIGVIVSGVMRASMVSTAVSARRDQVEGTLEILATQPISLMALGVGWAIVPIIEELLAGLITIAIAVPLGFNHITPNWPATVLVLILTAIMFIAIGFAAAALVLAIQQGTAAAGAVMSLISGALFPISVLPGWLRIVADASPLTYALRAARTAIEHGGDTSRLIGQMLTLVAISAVLLPVGLLTMRLAFDYARTRGTLARF